MKRHAHETKVLGIFHHPEQAKQAIQALNPMHLDPQDVRLVTSQEEYEEEDMVNFVAGEKLHEESVRAAKIGGIGGATLFGATAIAAILSGGSSLLVSSPLIVVLAGAGGVLGGLLNSGFTEENAKKVDEAIAHGEALVLVHAANRKIAHDAKDIFKHQGADWVHTHH